ncbi:MAG: hypothetical protein GY845_13320 [Planctomycetes bacterium]|nr:hypothetical protein [Planctomycetota bacterium]
MNTSTEYAHVAALIVEEIPVNADSKGLVAIFPVDDLYWIHTKEKTVVSEFVLELAGHKLKTRQFL